MKKVNNKKGFTLAELLVVLAILAVLVAVAIPLFTSAIGDAQETAQNANYRAVRAAAVVEILSNDSVPAKGSWGWSASATIGADGQMSGLTISKADAAVANNFVPAGSSKVAGTYTVGVQEAKS